MHPGSQGLSIPVAFLCNQKEPASVSSNQLSAAVLVTILKGWAQREADLPHMWEKNQTASLVQAKPNHLEVQKSANLIFVRQNCLWALRIGRGEKENALWQMRQLRDYILRHGREALSLSLKAKQNVSWIMQAAELSQDLMHFCKGRKEAITTVTL